jgi:uncharacterized protein YgiM (DUF1202 family)
MQRAYFRTFMIILVCLIVPVSGSALAAPNIPTHDAAFSQTGPYAVSSGAVYVRGGPGTGFWILGTLSLNEIVPILYVSPDNAWWYISAPFGEGWVANISVTAYNTAAVQPYDPGPIGTVTAGTLNVRYGPGPTAASLGHIGLGDQVYILAQNATGGWYQIRWAFGVGWASAQYITTSAGAVVPVDGQGGFAGEGAADGQGGFAGGDIPVTTDSPYAIVMATYLNVRSGPGPNFAILGQVYGSQQLPIIGRNNDSSWYQVSTVYGPGWVYAGYVVTRNEFGASPVTSSTAGAAEVVGPIGIVNTGALYVRTGPGPQYTSMGTLAGGTEAQIIGHNADWTWWLMDTSFGPGWVYGVYVLVRGDPGTVPYVAPGSGTATGLGEGQGGFAGDLGEGAAPAAVLAEPVAVVTTGAMHIRSGPNSSFPSLGVVYGGTRMTIKGQSPDHGWWYVDSAFGLGYVSKLYVLTDGNTSNVPVVQ